MNNPNVIIIETSIIMKDNDRENLRCKILSDINEGVVILPWHCKLVYPSEKTEEVESEKTKRTDK